MDFSKILTDYPFSTELHAHSFPVSACGDYSPTEVVEFYKASGVTSLVITNHLNPLWSEGDARERAEEYLSDYKAAKEAAGDDLNVILGIEIRFPENNNDYLVYGVCEDDIKNFIKRFTQKIKLGFFKSSFK